MRILGTGSTKSQNLVRGLALALVALGFGLRLYRLASESLWYDELLQLDIAQGPLDQLFPRLRGHSAVPLDYLISHLWIMMGRSDGWVRWPAVVAGTLSLPVAYQLGRRWLGSVGGLLLLGLLALSPFHIRYSQEVRPYALAGLGVLLAIYGFWRLRRSGRWRSALPLLIGLAVALLAHIFTVTMLFPFLLLGLVDLLLGANRRRVGHYLGATLLAILIPLLIFTWMGWGDVLFYTTREFGVALLEPGGASLETAQPAPADRGPSLTWPFVRDELLAPLATGQATWLSLGLFNLLAGLGLVDLLRRGRGRLALWLLLWLLLPPLLIIALLIFRQTFFAPRYIIFVLPAYLLLLAAGLLAVRRWLARLGSTGLAASFFWLLLGLVLLGLGQGLLFYYQHQNKEDWHLVADFLAQNAGPADVIIAFRAEPTLNWYYPPATARPNFYDDLDQVQQVVAGAERSWVILSIFSSEDDARLRAWLGEQQAVRLILDPVIHLYYLGADTSRPQLLAEIQQFALPADHALYASLARENRRRPQVARRYYQLALEYAPDSETRAEYRAALEALSPK